MRTALFSDVHGNAVALDALLQDLERAPVDSLVCLGDVAQGGPQPVEVLNRLRELDCPVVLGNADAFLLDPEAGREPTTERLVEVREWSVERLGAEGLAFLRGFAPTVEAELGGGRTLLGFHGSPDSYDDILLPTLPDDEFRSFVAEARADVLAGGHVHLQFLRRLGASVFVNPGSVGLSYDHAQPEDDLRADPWAAYAVVTSDDGRVEVSFRRVPFDPAEVIAAIRASGMPHAEAHAARWHPRE